MNTAMLTIAQIQRITDSVQLEHGQALKLLKETKPVAYAQLQRQLKDDPQKWRDHANNWRGSIPAVQRKNGESMEDAWSRQFDFTLDGRPSAESYDKELRTRQDASKLNAAFVAMKVLNDCITMVSTPGLNMLAAKVEIWGFVPGTWNPVPNEDGVVSKEYVAEEIARIREQRKGRA